MASVMAAPDEQVLALPPTLPHSIGGLLVLLVAQWLNVLQAAGA
jgi:hypothetical protein